MRPRFKRPSQLRPLPLAIVMMALLVVCKLVALVQGVATPAALVMAERIVLPMAHASAAAKAPSPPNAAPTNANGNPAPTRNAGAAPANAPAIPDATPPGSAASQAELAVLQDLRSRRTELDGRADALKTREQLLAAAEQRMAERVEQLTALQTRLEALDKTRRERDEANWQGLVKTYEKMRPRDAATIFNDLDETVLMQVLDRMKAANAASILGSMQPDRARSATAHLAEWRQRAQPEAK